MQNVDDIFTKLGGTGAVARIIDVKHSAASEMRRRGSIPVRYWPQLIDGAAALDVAIDSDLLVRVHVPATPTPEQPAPQGEAA
jgi:hypothetical protein